MPSGGSKLRPLIIGLGSYYRKLRPGIESHCEIVRVVDCRPAEVLALTPNERARFQRVSVDLQGLALDEPIDSIMLLTPPAFHVPHIGVLARLRRPILVEKPRARNEAILISHRSCCR